MRLTFIGAAQAVTGSCFLVETDDLRFLVDCGMFQGGREARERNCDRASKVVLPLPLDLLGSLLGTSAGRGVTATTPALAPAPWVS